MTTSFIIPLDIKLIDLLERLSGKLANSELHSHRLKRRYLDSLDWRLLKKGYYLQADTFQNETLFQLYELKSDRLLTQWIRQPFGQTEGQLRHGKLFQLITPILKERALTAQIEQSLEQKLIRVFNNDRKLIAKLVIDSYLIPEKQNILHVSPRHGLWQRRQTDWIGGQTREAA